MVAVVAAVAVAAVAVAAVDHERQSYLDCTPAVVKRTGKY